MLVSKSVYDATSKVCQEYKNNCILTDHGMNCENEDLQKNTAVNTNVDVNKWMSGLTPPNQSVDPPFLLNFFLPLPSTVNILHAVSFFKHLESIKPDPYSASSGCQQGVGRNTRMFSSHA